jgi:hypothetical protein
MRHLLLVFLANLGSSAHADPVCHPAPGEIGCHALVRTTNGAIHVDATPQGFGPADLQAAYRVLYAASTTPTIAVVDAYNYSALESDLGMYRAQFGLPTCTIANGCLRIVNENGQPSPMPPDAPANDDWTVETALDVDMASAACPQCKLLVVLASSTQLSDLVPSQRTAVQLGATVVSDSWGGVDTANHPVTEPYFDHAGVPTFVSAGDDGYNQGGMGPHYPSTSAFVIAVGGTRLVRDGSARGWSEVAWTNGGSSCSTAIPKPAYQPASPCAFRAASDVAAVADTASPVAVYNANHGGWIEVGGTSASAPLVAGMVAASGLAPQVSAAWFAQHASLLHDVTSGTNGSCGSVICNAGPGWDGPTGFGTPDMTALTGMPAQGGPSVMITSPADGATVAPGFTVTASIANAVSAELRVDGATIATRHGPPFEVAAPPTLAPGMHEVEVTAIDESGTEAHQSIEVTVERGAAGAASSGELVGGCSAHGAVGPVMLLACVLLFAPQRRSRRRSARTSRSALG